MDVIDRIDRRLSNMRMMLERLGIDPVEFSWRSEGLFLASAIPTCQACANDEKCHDWLVRSTGPLREAPAFCPNAPLFAWAKAERPRGQPAERA